MIVKIDNSMTGKKFKEYRDNLKLSLSTVSNSIGVSKTSISRCEKGLSMLNTENIVKLCRYYNQSIDKTLVYNILK